MAQSQRISLRNWMDGYVDTLANAVKAAAATDGKGKSVSLSQAIDLAIQKFRAAHESGHRLIFIGNGGSAAICSHMATDYSKNGQLRALAMNDSSTLTCLSNDFGYEHVFAKQIEFQAHSDDILIAISSSGRSANILNAVAAARTKGCEVITLSGFQADNPLRSKGDLNLYIDSDQYGFVEIGHLTLCHAILDRSMELDGRGPRARTAGRD